MDSDSEFSDLEQDYDTAHSIKPPISSDFRSPGGRNHEMLLNMFAITEVDEQVFLTLLCLCDPKTQPSESNEYVLSIQYLSELLIGIQYCGIVPELEHMVYHHRKEDESPEPLPIEFIKFKMADQLCRILLHILPFLGVTLENELHADYGFDQDDWEQKIHFWGPKLPLSKDLFNLRTTYFMACILLNCLNELFDTLALNPYCSKFTELWKVYTALITIALTIDQRMELEDFETPGILIEILKGTSMVRYILGYILNQSSQSPNPKYIEDLHNKSLLDVYFPNNRKHYDGGALTKIIHFYEFHQLILDLGINLNYDDIFEEKYSTFDTFDEDVRYIFEYDSAEELSDIEGDDEDEEQHENQKKEVQTIDPSQLVSIKTFRVHPELLKDTSKYGELHRKTVNLIKEFAQGNLLEDQLAYRSENNNNEEDDDDSEISDNEMAQGENKKLQQWFKDDVLVPCQKKVAESSNFDFLVSFHEIKYYIENIILDIMEDKESIPIILQNIINRISIANYCSRVFELYDPTITSLATYLFQEADENHVEPFISRNLIIPVYSIKNFELLFVTNPEFCRVLFVELLLVGGKRRVLIWKLCHELNLSHNYIDFICQLLIGFPLDQATYKNTRSGKILELTEVEKSMLLNEFIESSLTFLSAADGIDNEEGYELTLPQSVCNKFVHLICMLISKLINEKVINLQNDDDEDEDQDNPKIIAIHSIVGFLFQYISKVPLARKLYFEVLNLMKSPQDGNKITKPKEKKRDKGRLSPSRIIEQIIEIVEWQIQFEINGKSIKLPEDPCNVIKQFIDNFSRISEDALLMYSIIKRLPRLSAEPYDNKKLGYKYEIIQENQIEETKEKKPKKAKKKKKKNK